MYLHETIRDAIITRIEAVLTSGASFYRQPSASYEAYPAVVLEYADNKNLWSSNHSDKKTFMFNLYVVYSHENTDASREEAEKNISNTIGELYRDVFSDPGTLNLPNGWVRASDTSWGYGTNPDIPLRMAMLQLEVTVHEDRA